MRQHQNQAIEKRFLISLALTALILVAEVLGGLWTGSLALLSDAAHVFLDIFALALSYIAVRLSALPADDRHTYGFHRWEVIAALANGVTLAAVAVGIFVEAYHRVLAPEPVKSVGLLVIAAVGLTVNLLVALVLRGHSHAHGEPETEDLNVHSAFLHVVGDAVSSVGVIVAALVIWRTGWVLADPLMSVLIGLIIVASSWRVTRASLHILVEGAPEGFRLADVAGAMDSVPGVTNLHDLHVWSLCSGHIALSAHVVVADQNLAQAQSIMDELKGRLQRGFGVEHTTIQFECVRCEQGAGGCGEPLPRPPPAPGPNSRDHFVILRGERLVYWRAGHGSSIIKHRHQPRGVMTDTPLLKVENLSLVRNGHRILNDVNLVVYPGQVHALLGLNGSGKSSLAYALMGCAGYKPDSGHILFRDQDITSMAIHQRARLGLTLAWQEPARFEGLPVGKYIALGMAEFNRDQALAALEAVALPPRSYVVRPVNDTLSGGERKRVELAAVYAMRPQLAILDEPDSGIDALSLDDIGMLIRDMAQAGSAVLLISHRDEMVSVADSASIMCLGTIIFSGDPATAHEYYRGRCAPHMASLGNQPWNKSLPEVRAALESDAEQAAGRLGREGQP